MSTLYIGNSYNDALVGDLRQFDHDERQIGGNLSCRLVWLMAPGDLLLSPQYISAEFLEYARQSQSNVEFDSLIGLGAKSEAKPATKEKPAGLPE